MYNMLNTGGVLLCTICSVDSMHYDCIGQCYKSSNIHNELRWLDLSQLYIYLYIYLNYIFIYIFISTI